MNASLGKSLKLMNFSRVLMLGLLMLSTFLSFFMFRQHLRITTDSSVFYQSTTSLSVHLITFS